MYSKNLGLESLIIFSTLIMWNKFTVVYNALFLHSLEVHHGSLFVVFLQNIVSIQPLLQ